MPEGCMAFLALALRSGLSLLVSGGSSLVEGQPSLLPVPHPWPSTPQPSPGRVKRCERESRDSVLFVLGSMESHLHVLIATNWH